MIINDMFFCIPETAMPERQKFISGIITCTIILAATLIITSCDTGDEDETTVPGSGPTREVSLPQENAAFDYQLGGAYTPPAGTMTVTRDRTDIPVPGLYNICYINGFQVQPGEEGGWDPDLILRDINGDPVYDTGWGEMLLDTSTSDKRARIAAVISGWIEDCAADGFNAVEIDNLDSYSRSQDPITHAYLLNQDHAVALMSLLSAAAHENSLAIAQKNSTELLSRKPGMGTDFAVAEECSAWDECQDYVDVYGNHVLMIEYDVDDFNTGCSDYGSTHPIILRDYDLVTPADSDYVYDQC